MPERHNLKRPPNSPRQLRCPPSKKGAYIASLFEGGGARRASEGVFRYVTRSPPSRLRHATPLPEGGFLASLFEGGGAKRRKESSCHVPTRGFSRWRNDVRRIVASLTAKLASPAEAGKAARKRGRSPDRTQWQHPVSQSVVFMGTGLEALEACLPQIIHTCPHDLPHPIDTAICVLRWPPAQ